MGYAPSVLDILLSNTGNCIHHLDWPLFLLVAWGSGVQVGDADEIDGFFLWTQHSSTGPLDSTAAPMGILKAKGGGISIFFVKTSLDYSTIPNKCTQ